MDESVVASFGDDHDGADGAFYRAPLELFGNFTDGGGGLHEAGV